MPSWDEASCCPRCGLTATETSSKKLRDGSIVHTMTCQNNRCRWGGTSFIIQTLKDGSIPERKPGPKSWEPMTQAEILAGKRILEALQEEMERPTGPGTI